MKIGLKNWFERYKSLTLLHCKRTECAAGIFSEEQRQIIVRSFAILCSPKSFFTKKVRRVFQLKLSESLNGKKLQLKSHSADFTQKLPFILEKRISLKG